MNNNESSSAIDTEALAQEIQQASAEKSNTIGDYTSNVRETAQTLMKGDGPLADVGAKLNENASQVQEAAGGSTSINIDASLEPGLNGFTQIGGSDSTVTINADLLAGDPERMKETIMHEQRHNEQVSLQHNNGDALLITASGQRMENETQGYEADTETTTAKVFGERNGKPRDYQVGYDIGKEVQQDHADAWNETLTKTGDLGALQQKIWEKALKDGKIDVPELLKQAEETGYTKEAAKVLSAHIKSGAQLSMAA